MTRQLMTLLACFTLGLSACVGGNNAAPAPEPPPVPEPEVGRGSVTAHVINRSGEPVPGIRVSLNGAVGRAALTDADGRVQFRDIPAGDADVSIFARGYHSSWRSFVIEADTTTEVQLTVVRAAEATPAVLATHATPSADARILTVEVDVAVLAEDGLAIPTLTAVDFEAMGSDCAFMWCVMDATGAPLSPGGYVASLDSEAFDWHEVPAEAPPASATALLLEQSTVQLEFDPHNRRSNAVKEFLDAVTAPDSVTIAGYHGTAQAPVLTTYGPFTSDGAEFRDDVDALSAIEASQNPMYAGLGGMLSWTDSQAVGSGIDTTSIVLVSNAWSWSDSDCDSSWTCDHESRTSVASDSRALGIPVVTIGGREPAADIAARSGGVSVVLGDPAQYRVALANLDSIVARRIGYNRLRLVLESPAPVFQAGHTVWAYVLVRIGPDTPLSIPVAIPIPPTPAH